MSASSSNEGKDAMFGLPPHGAIADNPLAEKFHPNRLNVKGLKSRGCQKQESEARAARCGTVAMETGERLGIGHATADGT